MSSRVFNRYGHKVHSSKTYGVLSIEEAELLLKKDVLRICHGVNKMTCVRLLQNKYDAIVSFVFNVGLGAYQRSILRLKINRNDHIEVPSEIRKWVYVGLNKSKGLIKRREAEALLYQIQ